MLCFLCNEMRLASQPASDRAASVDVLCRRGFDHRYNFGVRRRLGGARRPGGQSIIISETKKKRKVGGARRRKKKKKNFNHHRGRK